MQRKSGLRLFEGTGTKANTENYTTSGDTGSKTPELDGNINGKIDKPDIKNAKATADKTYGDDQDKLQNKYKNWNSDKFNDTVNFDKGLVNPYDKQDLRMTEGGGNMNLLPYEQTLRYSRMADYLNNMMQLKPTSIGRRTRTMGSTGTGLEGIGLGYEKIPGIETQEMRQMRANEAAAMQKRQADLAREQRILDYAQTMREKLDANQINFFNEYMNGYQTLNLMAAQAVYAKEYNARYDQFLQNMAKVFVNNLNIQRAAELSKWINHSKDLLSSMLAAQFLGGTAADPITRFVYSQLENAMKNDPEHYQENMQLSKRVIGMFSDLMNLVLDTGRNVFPTVMEDASKPAFKTSKEKKQAKKEGK